MAFELPALPYEQTALEPHISSNTLSYHHGKHHQTYVTNLNNMVEGTDLADKSLEEVVRATAGNPDKAGIFNNAAQVWNHTFYWNSMKPGGGGAPTGDLASRIDASFGSYEAFAEAFSQAAATQFGSGWAWLVAEGDALSVVKTGNAETPITGSATPLVTIDVWEHAYYLDYQNLRPAYIKTFLESLVNWDFAAANLG
ncbi:MAG: superoxide dismutase [Alphaproteobacteria bacterium]|jgi:Fe-Mn family superoxide dismutase|nr:superoxide dismutase [Alphaproteobacteria bacterium]